jgi:hypothetical protein
MMIRLRIQPPHVIIKNFFFIILGCALPSIVVLAVNMRMSFPWWQRPDTPPIMLHTSYIHMGERNLGIRSYQAAQQLGYPTIFITHSMAFNLIPPLRWSLNAAVNLLHWWYQPKWHLSLTHLVTFTPPSPAYVFINAPYPLLLDKNGRLKEAFRSTLPKYQGYLDINGYGTEQKNYAWLREMLAKEGITTLPPTRTVSLGVIINPLPPVDAVSSLVVFGTAWGGRDSLEYVSMFQQLAKKIPLEVYGIKDTWSFIPEKYQGALRPAELLPIIHRNGVSLIYHSNLANQVGIPSGRSFETLSAGGVIISDDNTFIKEHFGDSVLYYDNHASGDVMAAQILAHITMLKTHPEKAHELARRSQAIGRKLFPIEAIFTTVEEMEAARKQHSD